MSKMNVLRIINLNYNNNAIRIDDESFSLGGENTLLSLRNGGGKSVLVQMMSAPFVQKKYRNTKDRPFRSYFTTAQPTHILVEWQLDGGGGYLLTGMMVRKKQEQGEETNEDLEVITYIYPYKSANPYDIRQIPLIENKGNQKKLQSFTEAKKLFETLKKDKNTPFNYYDLSQAPQGRRYFEHLREYKIDHKEWEGIIRKINFEESGLSKLFAEAKDEKGLVEKWFLPAIETKLSKEEGKMKKFVELVMKYIEQYRANLFKIQRKETIDRFKEETQLLIQAAQQLEDSQQEVLGKECTIAQLIDTLRQLYKSTEEELEGFKEQLDQLEEAIREVQYEELSHAIYKLADDKAMQIEEMERLAQDVEEQKRVRQMLIKDKNIQECAQLYEKYQEASKAVQEYENDLTILRQKDENLTPERNNLGYNLRLRYEELLKQREEAKKLLEQHLEANRNKRAELVQKDKQLNELQINQGNQKGKLEAYITQFDEREQTYNKKYAENLSRNIMGSYDEGHLENQLVNKKLHLTTAERELVALKTLREEQEENLKITKRNEGDQQKKLIIHEQKSKQDLVVLEDYEKELDIRRQTLRYVDLGEQELFEIEKINAHFEQKIHYLKKEKRVLESEEEKKQELYKKLKIGRILELPKAIELKLSEEEIDYVYGVDWLKRNQKTPAENTRLINQNPFIPYALIMSHKNVAKLQSKELDIYTSFPIPIIKREDLEEAFEIKQTAIYSMEKVSFMIAFNHELLDEKGLQKLLEVQKMELDSLYNKLQQKETEIRFYEEKKSQMVYQQVTVEKYQDIKRVIAENITENQSLEEVIQTLRSSGRKLEKEQKEAQQTILRQEKVVGSMQSQIQELEQLINSYESYCENRRQLERLKEIQRSQLEQQRGIQYEIEELERQIEKNKQEYSRCQDEIKVLQAKQTKFASYHEGLVILRDIEDMEARYESITKEIGVEQRTLEKNLERAKSHYNRAEEDLMYKQEEYALAEGDYRQIVYERFKERTLKNELQKVEESIQQMQNNYHQIDKERAGIEATIKEKIKGLEKVGEEKPKDRHLIKQVDFKALQRQYQQEKKNVKTAYSEAEDKQSIYRGNLGYLKEYEEFPLPTSEVLKGLPTLNEKMLDDFRGKLIRDYKAALKESEKKQRNVEGMLDKVSRQEHFKDEFFSIPLENLQELTATPNIFLEQLQVTLSSYGDLVAKLEVDIAMIAEEKEKVLEILLQYIYQVHEQMSKIDKNSSITVRKRSIKMLKILLPNWQEQEGVYYQRAKELLEQLTTRGIASLEQGENIEELVGSQITTKTLYNDIVGIGNVEIKLYKIEEEREYQISWIDVSKNSGGEGFLSAFVILSSLLSFIRREDTDIFSDYEDGKVLVMDNPFAQTNAEHLLKPLINIAKKNNTQLICLSGLGGESIYNRFDNIYVLNLVASRLKSGTQYLTSEHKKGQDIEEVKATHIKIEEVDQIQLF